MSYQAVRSPEAASTVLFGLPIGRTAYFQPSPQQGGWIVLRDGPEAGPERRSERRGVAGRLGPRDRSAARNRWPRRWVWVNPRFGVWDPVSMRVIAANQEGGAILPLMG
jgi:hypothetical protein